MKAKIRRIDGLLKDTASLWRTPKSSTLKIAVIHTTSHEEKLPSDSKLLMALNPSTYTTQNPVQVRDVYSDCLSMAIERLHGTKNWIVAIKCLILIHKIIYGSFHGSFTALLRSFYPNFGGRNGLNLSKFRDDSSVFAMEASSWIRWYARFLEALMEASRTLGKFLSSSSSSSSSSTSSSSSSSTSPTTYSSSSGADHATLMMPSKMRIMALQSLLHEICLCPLLHAPSATAHFLLKEAFKLVVSTSLAAQRELRNHLRIFSQGKGPPMAMTSPLTSPSHSMDAAPLTLTLTLTSSSVPISVDDLSTLRQMCNELASDSSTLSRLVEVSRSMNLLHSHVDPESDLLTSTEIREFKEVLNAVLLARESSSCNSLVISSRAASMGVRAKPLTIMSS